MEENSMTREQMKESFKILSGPWDTREDARYICDLCYTYTTPGATVVNPEDDGYFVVQSNAIVSLNNQ